jgi:hypothetical protein
VWAWRARWLWCASGSRHSRFRGCALAQALPQPIQVALSALGLQAHLLHHAQQLLHGGGRQIPCGTRHRLLSLLDRVGQLPQRFDGRRILQLSGRLQRLLQLLLCLAHPGALDYSLPPE